MELKVVTEEWRPIVLDGSQTRYLVSNLGNIWSVINGKLLNPSVSSGYKYVTLSHEGKKYKNNIHRLVAITFIANPNNLEYVNHKNGDKFDNRLENLEWTTPSGNKQHATDTLGADGPRVGVYQYSLDGTEFIAHYDSIAEAARQTGTSQTGITDACRGKYNMSGGFTWRYVDATRLIEDREPEGFRHPDHPNYIITSDGKVYSSMFRKYMTQQTDKNGYQCVSLCTKGHKQNFVVHVMVAKFFVHNPDPLNKIYVNHINNKRDDNDYRNLEWVTHAENIDHAYKHGGLRKKLGPVVQYDNLGNEIQRFISISEAARAFKVTPSAISIACDGTGNCCGFRWKYADLVPMPNALLLNIVPIYTNKDNINSQQPPTSETKHLTLSIIN